MASTEAQPASDDAPRDPQLKAPAALFGHCLEVWDTMAGEATRTTLEGSGQPVLLWKGFTTKVFQRLHLSVPYYTSVTRALQDMDCMRQIRRGGGGSESEWVLVQRPTVPLWDAYEKNLDPAKAPSRRSGQLAAIQQQLRDLAERVTRLEEASA